MNNRLEAGTCMEDNTALNNNNPQEGQGGESALACREPHCYAWGTIQCPDLFLLDLASFESHFSASSYIENCRSRSLKSLV